MAENDKENIIINKNKVLAKSLGLRGTPALIINDTIMPGYVKIDNLRSMIKQ
jgi:protein-disulfide isomerase